MSKILTFVFLFALLLPLSAEAVRIEISAPGEQTIPLALTRFLPMGKAAADSASEIDAVLSADLDLSGLFELADRAAFLSDAEELGLHSTQVDFAQWRLLGVDAVVKGGYRIDGEKLTIEARLYDVVTQQLLTGRRYVGRIGDERRIAHSFADQIMLALTGKKGPFNSRLAYISTRSGHKELYLMEVDGHNPVRLTDHRSIVLDPDFSPLRKEIVYTSYKKSNPDLYRKEIYTGSEARLSHRTGLNTGGRYRADGGELAVTLSKGNNSDIYLLGTDGSIHKRLTTHWGIDVAPSWNPEGDKVAFVSDRRGNPQIFIVDVNSLKIEVAKLGPGDVIKIGNTEMQAVSEESQGDVTMAG